MSVQEEIALLKTIIETQAARIESQEKTIKELRTTVTDLRSIKANLEETKTVQVKSYTATRKKKATREELYALLPVREIICPVPEKERNCDWCNTPMIPLKPTFVREEIRRTINKRPVKIRWSLCL